MAKRMGTRWFPKLFPRWFQMVPTPPTKSNKTYIYIYIIIYILYHGNILGIAWHPLGFQAQRLVAGAPSVTRPTETWGQAIPGHPTLPCRLPWNLHWSAIKMPLKCRWSAMNLSSSANKIYLYIIKSPSQTFSSALVGTGAWQVGSANPTFSWRKRIQQSKAEGKSTWDEPGGARTRKSALDSIFWGLYIQWPPPRNGRDSKSQVTWPETQMKRLSWPWWWQRHAL